MSVSIIIIPAICLYLGKFRGESLLRTISDSNYQSL